VNMSKDLITVTLTRGNNDAWGFRLAGGKDYGQPLSISQVYDGSMAAILGLNTADLVVEIADQETFDMTHEQAEQAIHNAGNKFQMLIERETKDRKISTEKSVQQFSLKLGGPKVKVQKEVEAFISNVEVTEDTPALLDLDDDGVNFKKYEKPEVDVSASATLENNTETRFRKKDMAKPHNRKDWNCPWVRKDGRGLKQAIRAIDGPTCPIRTSCKPYYSEPKSILGEDPILTPEQLQQVIEEQGCGSRSNSRIGREEVSRSRPDSRQQYQQESWQEASRHEKSEYHQESTQQYSSTQEYSQFNGDSHRSTVNQESHSNHVTTKTRIHEESNGREREEDSQAPPPLETVEQQELSESRYLEENGMGSYEEEGFEPSADELIDVLKNLENLAAANPGLYKAIVEQIKDNTGNLEEGEEIDCIGSGNPNITGTGKISKVLKSALKAKQPTT